MICLWRTLFRTSVVNSCWILFFVSCKLTVMDFKPSLREWSDLCANRNAPCPNSCRFVSNSKPLVNKISFARHWMSAKEKLESEFQTIIFTFKVEIMDVCIVFLMAMCRVPTIVRAQKRWTKTPSESVKVDLIGYNSANTWSSFRINNTLWQSCTLLHLMPSIKISRIMGVVCRVEIFYSINDFRMASHRSACKQDTRGWRGPNPVVWPHSCTEHKETATRENPRYTLGAKLHVPCTTHSTQQGYLTRQKQKPCQNSASKFQNARRTLPLLRILRKTIVNCTGRFSI